MACGQSGGVFRAREFAIKSIFEMYFLLFIAFHSAKLFGTDELSETYIETISVSFTVLRDDNRGSKFLSGIPRTKPLFPVPDKGSRYRNHIPHERRRSSSSEQLPTFHDDDTPSPPQTQISRLSISPFAMSSHFHLPRKLRASTRWPITRKVLSLRLREGSRTST